MSQLSSVRRRIALLRRWRALMRGATAWAGLLIAILGVLAAMFTIDVIFEMDIPQRLLVMAIGGAVVVWTAVRYALPLWRVRESLMQVALLVERQHAIRSDLVAALQFETPAAARWGSPQMEQAVIEQVASQGNGLRVFAGFSHPQARRRLGLLALTGAVLVATAALIPDHVLTFARRLALSADHYPSATRIEAVAVNRQLVLIRQRHPTQPSAAVAAEGQPITLRVQASGRLADDGRLTLQGATGRRRTLLLEGLSLEQRRQLLEEVAGRIQAAREQAVGDATGPWSEEMIAALRFDAPAAAAVVEQAGGDAARLADAAEAVAARLADWPGIAHHTAIYECRLSRLVDAVDYQLYVGDAWTDVAQIRMIPLPAVELVMDARPPEYAAQAEQAAAVTGSRQLSVLEGSEVRIAVSSTNRKPLTAAWLTVADGDEASTRRFDLQPGDEQALDWSLPVEGTPFAQITRETRFEVQVTDRDGLHLETPLRGYVRIKADRPPTCAADVVHRVVLPTARPTIAYRVNDDYGIADVKLLVQIERASAGDERAPDQRYQFSLLGGNPLAADQLPRSGEYTLDLTGKGVRTLLPDEAAKTRVAASTDPDAESPLQLAKGDRLKLTLEATDFRGPLPGESCLSEPLILEISDESGVLSAISEADQRSEERLSEIIQQQLGIGESP